MIRLCGVIAGDFQQKSAQVPNEFSHSIVYQCATLLSHLLPTPVRYWGRSTAHSENKEMRRKRRKSKIGRFYITGDIFSQENSKHDK